MTSFDGRYGRDLPLSFDGGFKTPFGSILPPGGRVAAFVRSTGEGLNEEGFVKGNLVTTLAAGLARCRAGYGDTVIVLPGHSENVTDTSMLTNLAADTRIIGVGRGTSRPTFRWTATAAQWNVAVANVEISGLKLSMEGADGVDRAINVTGSDCMIADCEFNLASGASNVVDIAVEVSAAGAARFKALRNHCYGNAGVLVDDVFLVSAAAPDVVIANNVIICDATAAAGMIRFSAAALRLLVANNYLYNTISGGSTACISFANVACDGLCVGNRMAVKTDGTATSEGIIFTSASAQLVQCLDNLVCDAARSAGISTPVAET